MDKFDGEAALLRHTFLGYESETLQCLFHELASYHDARAVFDEPGVPLDVVDQHIECQLPVHGLIDQDCILLDQGNQVLIEHLKQHSGRIAPILVLLDRMLKAVHKGQFAIRCPIMHILLLGLTDLLECLLTI